MSVQYFLDQVWETDLKEGEEVVKLLARRTLVEVNAGSLENEVDETNTEKVVRHIKWIQPPWNWWTTVAKGHDLVHNIKDNGVFDQTVVVDLCQVLDLRDAPLVVLEVMLLQTSTDRLGNVVNHPHDELCAVSVEVRQQRGEQVNCTVFDLSGLGEDLFKRLSDLGESVRAKLVLQLVMPATYFCLFPVHPADLSRDLIKSPLRQVYVD